MLKVIEDNKLLTKNQIGVLYGVASVACFAMMDACVKWLDMLPVGEVLFSRFFFGLIPILMLVPRSEFKTFYKTTRPKLHAFRAISGTLAIVALFIALREIPLADVVSLTFGGPIFVTLGSIFFLSEKVGIRRWSAVIVGFIGILIVIRPGFIEFNLASFAAIGTGCFYGVYLIITRKLHSTDSPLLTLLLTGVVGAIIGTLIVPIVWVNPNLLQWSWLILMGLFACLGHILLIYSLKYADASKLAPFGYIEIVPNIVLGYYLFNDFLDLWSFIGLFIIICSGLYVIRREYFHKNK